LQLLSEIVIPQPKTYFIESGITIKSTPFDSTGLSLSDHNDGTVIEYLSLISAFKFDPQVKTVQCENISFIFLLGIDTFTIARQFR